MIRIAIFASGSGTNAQNIITYFANSKAVKVVQVLSNNKNAKVLERANKLKISSLCFDRETFYKSGILLNYLKTAADYIILAGFLWKVPQNIITAFPNKIINIHPALLPKYGGKGMYGMHVHNAVVKSREKESGITIHFVNENYDEGAILFQKKIEVLPTDTAEEVAKKIHELEYKHFPKVIEQTVLDKCKKQ